MANLSNQISDVRSAADNLRAAIDAIEVPLTLDDSTPELDSAQLDAALEQWFEASDSAFSSTLSPRDNESTAQALALIQSDLIFVSKLEQLEAGPSLEAGETGDPNQALADALDVVESGHPPQLQLGEATPEEALAAIDSIVKAGSDSVVKVTAAAVIPSPENLGDAIGAIVGASKGEVVEKVLGQLKNWWKKVARAAAKLLGKVLERIGALLGEERADQLKTWLEGLITAETILGRILQVDAVKADAKAKIEAQPDRAALVVALVDPNSGDHRWIGWGATALGLGKSTSLVAPPWGPVLLGAVTLALLAGAVWLTQDYLDSPSLDFLPDRVKGVGAVTS